MTRHGFRVRAATLEALFDPHDAAIPGERRFPDPDLVAFLEAAALDVAPDRPFTIRLTLDEGEPTPSGRDLDLARTDLRAGALRLLGHLHAARLIAIRRAMTLLACGMIVLVVGFLIGQVAAFVAGDALLKGATFALIGGTLIVSAWVLIWEATTIGVLERRDFLVRCRFLERLAEAELELAPARTVAADDPETTAPE